MREFHLPVWLGAAPVSHAMVFALLFFIESIARTILLTVVPLQAYRVLGDAQRVSLLYFGAGLVGIAGSLTIPWLVRRLRRRRVFSLGVLAMALAAVMFTREDTLGLAAGLALMAFATSCLGIAMNLYVMDHIQRRDLNRFEPMRMFLSASAWAVGPWLGVWLAANVQASAPFVLTMASSAATLGFFWYLRLTDNPAVASAPLRSPNPMRYLPRFFGQPRLRLAWILAVGRSGWWQLFYVYGPIYAVSNGFSDVEGGAIVSVGSAALFLVPLWGWLGRRYGLRRLLVASYGFAGILTMAVAAMSDMPWLGIVLIVGAALGASGVDGGGNVPFLRAVRPLERAEMTTVYMTYRNASQLGPPAIYAFLLRTFELPAVFIASGAMTLAMAWLSRYIPRRM